MDNWKGKIVYQIWPRSFNDSNGDGIGDIQGIIEKIPYLVNLGINMIWLSPVYLSPNKDYGYDISDYYRINPEFGTMEDFDALIRETTRYGIGIIMDLVANHTSDQHPWFREALRDSTSKYRDYYIFKEGKEDGPPNNWMSFFGGSAWTYDEKSEQYYLTQFTPNQCDLNWENPSLRQDIYKIMRFWLDRGVCGFRMDVINTISKAEGLPDKTPHRKGLQFPGELTLNRPKTHAYLKEMYQEVIEPYKCMTIGEGPLATPEDVVAYTNPTHHELQMMMHFDLHNLGYGELGKYDFRKLYKWRILDFKKVLYRWQEMMSNEEGWTGNYLSNHDQNRQVSRFGDTKTFRLESAKALCLLNLTLRGTPFIYQGEEIGMTDCLLEEEEWRDYEAMNAYGVLQSMMHLPKVVAERIVKKVTRDNSRTPMQWDDSENSGFTTGIPWIKVNPNYTSINVKSDLESKDSLFRFYQEMISVRNTYPVLIWGDFIPIIERHKHVVGYIRKTKERAMLILINLSTKTSTVHKKDIGQQLIKIIHCTHDMAQHVEVEGELSLRPYEARIYKIE
ncbi:MAG: alpha-glucosidase [Cellulosilyticaceae bacterium]